MPETLEITSTGFTLLVDGSPVTEFFLYRDMFELNQLHLNATHTFDPYNGIRLIYDGSNPLMRYANGAKVQPFDVSGEVPE